MFENAHPAITQLRDLYLRELSSILQAKSLCNASLAGMEGPFLACPPDSYFTAHPRILIVGQETHGWASTEDVELQMNACLEFMLGKSYRYPGPFWNVIKNIESACGFSERSIAWSNLNRYDRNGRPPQGDDLRFLPALDRLLVEEVAILNPDIVLFVTGPRFTDRIRAIFPGEWGAATGFAERQVAALQLPDRMMIQTYHPKALRMQKLEARFISYFRAFAGKSKKDQG